MSVPSDSEIKKAAAEILKGCDVATTTLKSIRTQLEERFQCSLAEKKSIIYESFDKFIAQNEDLIKYNDIVKSENDAAAPEEDGEVEATSKKKTKARGGFAADVHVSPELAEFLGTEVLPRTEVTKRIWAYIREHNLQDPRDKRKIMCDAALEKVLKRKSVHMFTMTKVLSAMMKSPKEMSSLDLPQNSDEEAEFDEEDTKRASKSKRKDEKKKSASKKAEKKDKAADKKKRKAEITAEESAEGSDAESANGDGNGSNGAKKSAKKAKGPSKFTISEGLCDLLGLQSDDTRYQVVAKMWEYIRAHSLQNPADKRQVRLDEALQNVFKVKTFTIFTMNKHISDQMIRNE